MGFSAIAFGITYGSYFGILWRPLWHDPVEGDPMGMVALGIGGGIVLMSIGLVLNMINKFRHRDWLGGFLDKFGMAGAIFYWGILGLCFTWAAVDRAGLAVVALVGVLVLPLLAIMIKEPLHVYLSRRRGHGEHGSMGEAIILAFIEAFDTVLLFMSNTISFIRLMAYSVAHAALLAVGFSIAGNMGDSVVGHIIGVVVIVIVNIIVILLEGIVSTIQAIRLEYYEFFGKFYTGGGMAFKPFRFSTKDE
jgi:V/A-type H+-transporting ATPase subunit I